MTKIRQENAPKDELIHDKSENTREEKKLAGKAQFHGEFEVEAARNGRALFAPLKVDDRTKRTVPGLDTFSEQYSIYKIPVHHTMTSLGRINDLRSGGAPRTPAEIPAEVMRQIKPVDNVSNKQSEQVKSGSANQWIEQQGELRATFDGFLVAREELQSANAMFRSAQQIILRRQLEAKKAGNEEEKKKIDEAAETLVKITKFSAKALTFTVALEAELLGVEEAYTATAEMDHDSGKGVQTAEVSRSYKTDKLKDLAKQAGGEIGLKEIFIWGMGKQDEYKALETAIGDLTRQIGQSVLNQEDLQIESAWKALGNVKLAIKGTQRAFTAKRGDARNAAQHFGQALGGREKTIIIALMAEAYHELDLFGTRSLEEANQLAPKARPVHQWLNDKAERYKADRQEEFNEFAHDYQQIGSAVIDAHKSRELLQTEVPVWQRTARTWRHFLSDVMGKSFDQNETDVDAGARKQPGT